MIIIDIQGGNWNEHPGSIVVRQHLSCGTTNQKDSEYAVAISNVVAEREKLPSEIQKRIEKLLNAQMDAAVIAERDAFVLGFRLAVQVMMDAMKHSAVTLE